MATRSRRFVSQGSGIAFAAIVATSMSVHNHRVSTDGLNGERSAIVGEASSHEQPLHVMKVAYRLNAKIYHHYP